MEIISYFVSRVIILFLAVWMGMSTAFFAGFLYHAWQRAQRTRPVPKPAPCQYCDGDGFVKIAGEYQVCPLCDGEAELNVSRELDAG